MVDRSRPGLPRRTAASRRGPRLAAALVQALLLAPLAASAGDPAQLVLHVVDYVAVDYAAAVSAGRVIDSGEFAEMQEFTRRAIDEIEALPANDARAALARQATQLARLVEGKADPVEVRASGIALRSAIIEAYGVTTVPAHPPRLDLGRRVYAQNCAPCHGLDGRGHGPAAAGLEPAPSDFHDAGRMAQRSLYGLYSTVTLGVEGTAMASFDLLGEQERWSVAAWVAQFSAGGAAPLDRASALLAESAAAYGDGRRDDAERLAIRAYLDGFEPVEAGLAALDPALVRETEAQMMELRGALDRGAPPDEVERRVDALEARFARARDVLDAPTGLSPVTAFVSSFLILAREGLEAILVLAAVMAFVRRAGRSEALPYVHAGWLAALGAGALTWAAATFAIEVSGAGREITEGATALIAAAMLLYVGYWLHDKAHAKAWSRFIGQQVGHALGRRTRWALAAVAFLAVYREVFEVVLFYQALWVQAGPQGLRGVLAGLVAAAVALGGVAWLILRYSVRLPIGPFFAVTSIVLAAMAVVFAGRGVAALQEAGVVSVTPIRFVSLPAVGLFPTTQTLAAQALMALAVAASFHLAARSARRGTGTVS